MNNKSINVVEDKKEETKDSSLVKKSFPGTIYPVERVILLFSAICFFSITRQEEKHLT